MTIFKTVFQITKKYKFTILLYTIILIFFTSINLETAEDTTTFIADKPDIYIINHDEDTGITKDFITYLSKHTNVISLKQKKYSQEDALFYRDINYLIEIPQLFRENFLAGNMPELNIKSTGDYQSTLAELLVKKYLQVAGTLRNVTSDEAQLIKKTNEILKQETTMEVTSKLDYDTLNRATLYFNFLNYSLLAGLVYVICLILSSFQEKNLHKRMLISSTSPQQLNRNLFLSISLVAFLLWAFYIALSFILLGSTMTTAHGLLYIANFLIFTLCALSIAFLIGKLVQSKSAINGIINVVALGSSFLCGSFVPVEYLPTSVLTIAKILPSYWFIQNNTLIQNLETIQLKNLNQFFLNSGIILIFMLLFIIGTNIISQKKTKIG